MNTPVTPVVVLNPVLREQRISQLQEILQLLESFTKQERKDLIASTGAPRIVKELMSLNTEDRAFAFELAFLSPSEFLSQIKKRAKDCGVKVETVVYSEKHNGYGYGNVLQLYKQGQDSEIAGILNGPWMNSLEEALQERRDNAQASASGKALAEEFKKQLSGLLKESESSTVAEGSKTININLSILVNIQRNNNSKTTVIDNSRTSSSKKSSTNTDRSINTHLTANTKVNLV